MAFKARAEEAARSDVPLEVRRDRIMATVADLGFRHVADLAADYGVSEVTIRNDLADLEQAGRLRRVRGGAVPLRRPLGEQSFEQTAGSRAAEKAAIGAVAANLVATGETVLLDVGSTAAALARALATRSDLTDVVVITNGLEIALQLEPAIPRCSIVVTGGTLRPLQHSLVNPLASQMLERLHADTVFLGCNGVHPDAGVTNINLPEAEVKREMVRAAGRRVVIADGSKIGQVSLAPLAGLDQVDVLITSHTAESEALDGIREAGVHVEVAR